MQQTREIEFVCPACGAHDQVECPEDVTSETDVQAKAALLDGSLFEHACSQCGQVTELEYPVLYKDLTHRTMVYYLPTQAAAAAACDQFARLDAADAASDNPRNLTRRVVTSHKSLAEKARILDAGLDDRAVEALKPIAAGFFQERYPDLEIDQLLLESVEQPKPATGDGKADEGSLSFVVYGSMHVSASVPRSYYDNLANDDVVQEGFASHPSYVIDGEWAVGALEAFDAPEE